jgi:beta-N-acetylhexosaminidase
LSPALLDAECAGLLCVGFDGLTPSPEVRELLGRGVYGGVLFARNVATAEQVAALTAELKRAAGRPLLVAVDQEGGRVARLRAEQGFEVLPPMRAVGEADDAGLARQVGALLGRQLRAVGIDQDYAPVVDVDSNPGNPVIGDRSLGRDPERVGRLGAALARGLQQEGVAACAKHFPGHGDTSQDSHRELPRLAHTRARLEAVELPPFRALAAAGVASMMTAHVVFEAVDPHRPATASPEVMRLLREGCGYDGAVLSDDLEMKAVADHFPLDGFVPEVVRAGVDGILVCHRAATQHGAIDALRAAVERGDLSRDRLAAARRRLARLLTWAAPPLDPGEVARAPERLAAARRPELLARLGGGGAAGRDPTA